MANGVCRSKSWIEFHRCSFGISVQGLLSSDFCYPELRIDRKSVTHTRRLHLKTMPLIFISIILGPLGNVFLGKAMKGVGSLDSGRDFDLVPLVSRLLTSGYIWLGVACLLGFFLAHMLLLTWADYSYVQPATSLSYLTISVLSYFILGETISPLRWFGVFVICLGVFLVGQTSPSGALERA